LDQSVSGGVGVSGDRLFVGTSEGQVLALDAGNGSVLWRQTLRGEVLSAPQSDGRVVVVQTYDGRAQGLDAKTGDLLWTYDSNVPVLTIRGTSTPILRDGNAYVGFANGRVVAFDVEKGTVEWELRVAIAQGRSEIERMVDIDGALEIIGNELYAASYQGYLVAADVRTGRKLWQQEVSTVSGVSQGFSNVYVSDQDGTVSAYYRNGQGLRWAQSDLSYRAPTKPVPVASYLAFTDFDGVLHLLSQVDGRFVGRDKIGAAARADIISQGNRFFVFTDKGKLIAYEVSAKD
jgi:outer membrane protein assembly factor BamB